MKVFDFPKLHSPFVRAQTDKGYYCTDKIDEQFRWVFEEPDVEVTEKLDGTNVSIVIVDKRIIQIFNRTNCVWLAKDGIQTTNSLVHAVMESWKRGYMEKFIREDGQYFGEVIGPKLQGNPYKLDTHIWLPFNYYVREHLQYKTYHKYPKDFKSLRQWLLNPVYKGGIFSLYMRKQNIETKPEGVVFYNPKTGERAKLRLDMFEPIPEGKVSE